MKAEAIIIKNEDTEIHSEPSLLNMELIIHALRAEHAKQEAELNRQRESFGREVSRANLFETLLEQYLDNPEMSREQLAQLFAAAKDAGGEEDEKPRSFGPQSA